MIYFTTALYREAAPVIEQFRLKKQAGSRPFDLFSGESAVLAVTGPGMASAAAGTACLLTLFPPDASGFFVNFGSCGCTDPSVPPGTPFLIDQILELATGRLFYPDLIFASPFRTTGLTTCPSCQSQEEARCRDSSDLENRDSSGRILFDMEGSCAYQSARYFLKQHQIAILKVVTDYGSENAPQAGELERMLTPAAALLPEWLLKLQNALSVRREALTAEEKNLVAALAEKLHFTEAMYAEVMRLLTYASLSGQDIRQLTAPCLEEEYLCKSKKEGKYCLEQLKQRILDTRLHL